VPKVKNPSCFHFVIGYQHIVCIDISIYKEEVIFDKVIENLWKKNLFWFENDEQMYLELDDYIAYTNEDCYVLIG